MFKHEYFTTGFQYPPNFSQGDRWAGNTAKHKGRDHGVKTLIGKWEVLGTSLDKLNVKPWQSGFGLGFLQHQ